MRPQTTEDLAEAIRAATGPLRISGGGTRALGVRAGAGAGEALATTGLSGVTLYEPGALTLVARAGTPLAEIEALLASENQHLPFDPPRLAPSQAAVGAGRTQDSTIGGVVAANASGPRRVQAGACRDSLIGVTFVDGSGTEIRNGGRVMKNVTGYDLVKLMAGSHGTLGVLTEVAFKLLPRPETEATLILHGLGVEEAARAMTRALGTPWEISGASMGLPDASGLRRVALRLEGFETNVTRRLPRLEAHLAGFGTPERLSDPTLSAGLWRGLRDLSDLQDARQLLRVSIRPSHLPALVAALEGEDIRAMADWGGGLVWLAGGAADLRARARGFVAAAGGHVTVIRGDGGPVFQPEPPDVARLSALLRARFDPRRILNPGLMD